MNFTEILNSVNRRSEKKIQMLKKSSFRLKLQQNLIQEYNFSLVFNFYFYRDSVCDKIEVFCSPLNQEKCGQIFAYLEVNYDTTIFYRYIISPGGESQ